MASNPGLPPVPPPPRSIGANTMISEPLVGDTCPACQEGRLEYDGLLNLACDQCGYSLNGCFT